MIRPHGTDTISDTDSSPEKLRTAREYSELVAIASKSKHRPLVKGVETLVREGVINQTLPPKHAVELYYRIHNRDTEISIGKRVPYKQSDTDLALERLKAAKKGQFVGVFTPAGYGVIFSGTLKRDASLSFGRRWPGDRETHFDDFLTLQLVTEKGEWDSDVVAMEPHSIAVGEDDVLSMYKDEMVSAGVDFRKPGNSSMESMLIRHRLLMSATIGDIGGAESDKDVEMLQHRTIDDLHGYIPEVLMDTLWKVYARIDNNSDDFFKRYVKDTHNIGSVIRALVAYNPEIARKIKEDYLHAAPLKQVPDYEKHLEFVDEEKFREVEKWLAATVDVSLDTAHRGAVYSPSQKEFDRSIRKMNTQRQRRKMSSTTIRKSNEQE